MTDKTLPDDHTRTLTLTLNVAEFREVMRSLAYRAAELPDTDTDPLGTMLRGLVDRVGEAWEREDPDARSAITDRDDNGEGERDSD
ncbi:hypothetical protein ACIQU6_07500 [Streptomyces sp. NPDC090442]|uniref:hypothetical protein n=1 Tax=Streptomyces sp. NPDC090442 TaxID=3365962 RepID=UPI003802F06C